MIAGSEWQIACSFLSSMYICKPAREVIKNWKTLVSKDVPEFMLDLKDAVDEINLNSEQELEDLLWEYTRLFIGPYKLPCPPWESVYTSSERLMMQDAYGEVQQLYKEAGVAIDSPEIMADHIGAEFNFMAVLFQKIDNEPGKRPYYEDVAKRFLHEHLLKWVPQFTQDMEKAADSLIYKRLAQLTRNFIMNACNHFA